MAVPGLAAEIIVHGIAAAEGSNPVNTAFIFHYQRASAVPPLVKGDLDTIFQSTVVAKILLALNNTWAQTGNSIRFIDDATDGPVTFAHANPGVVVGDAMPKSNAVYMLIRTGLRGKHYRGSKHFGPISEGDSTAGSADLLNAGAITKFNTIGTAMMSVLTDASGNNWSLAVLSRSLSQLLVNPTNVVIHNAVSVNLNKRIGRMRRREPRSVY